jgi:HPt (histidine-containing phosphotransfer) domain-containing protein
MTGKITEEQLREQVGILAGKFLERTATQVPQLRAEVERLEATGDPQALRSVQELAHKIHGSGAMFGFDAISDVAGELEKLSTGHGTLSGDSDRASLTALASTIRPLLDRLAAALNAAVQGR